MANSPQRSINYTPRMSEFEAYDLLPSKVRHALQEAAISFGSYAVYRYNEEHGIRATLKWIEEGNKTYSTKNLVPARGIKGAKGYRPAWPSTVIACKVRMLRANWP